MALDRSMNKPYYNPELGLIPKWKTSIQKENKKSYMWESLSIQVNYVDVFINIFN